MADAVVWTRETLRVGQRATVSFVVTDADMRAFAALSGDYNPLHTDPAFAAARGFPGVVVYGGLLVAKVSQLVGMQLPGRDAVWASVTLRFHQPLFVHEAAEVEGEVTACSEATGFVTLRLQIRRGAEVLARGTAEGILPSPIGQAG